MKILKYIDGLFYGRIGRVNYLLGLIFFSFIFFIFLKLLSLLVGLANPYFGNSFPAVTLLIILYLVLFISFIIYVISLIIRRLHDMGMKGWWIIVLFFVPIGNVIIAVMLLAGPGQKEINQYGEITTSNKFLNSIFNIKLQLTV